jgi:hypothetical protein
MTGGALSENGNHGIRRQVLGEGESEIVAQVITTLNRPFYLARLTPITPIRLEFQNLVEILSP